MSALIGCVPGFRQAIYDAIIGWYDKFFSVRYESPLGQEKETLPEENTNKNEQNVVPTFIAEARKPTNLPEGVLEDIVLKSNAKVIIDYYVGEELLFSFTQFVLEPFDKYIDNEDMNVTYAKINGNDATVIEYKSQEEKCILWNDKEYTYQISSNTLAINELIEYANSVK